MDPSPSFRDASLGEFVARLASPEPVPGGGSASAVAAALAASLVVMVASLSRNRTRYEAHASLNAAAQVAAQRLTAELLDIADEDARAYAACAIALKLPRTSPAEQEARAAEVRATARVAAEIPLRCVERCHDVLVLAEALAGRSNTNASSDLRVAALLARAGGRGAAQNVLVNIPLIGEDDWTRATEARIAALLDELGSLERAVEAVVAGGEARPPLAAPPEIAA